MYYVHVLLNQPSNRRLRNTLRRLHPHPLHPRLGAHRPSSQHHSTRSRAARSKSRSLPRPLPLQEARVPVGTRGGDNRGTNKHQYARPHLHHALIRSKEIIIYRECLKRVLQSYFRRRKNIPSPFRPSPRAISQSERSFRSVA